MKYIKKGLVLILVITVALHFPAMSFVKVSADDQAFFDVTIQDYYKYSGKFLIYFDNVSNAASYDVYIDDSAVPAKTIHSSGDYISKYDMEELEAGEHTMTLVAVKSDGTELARSSSSFVTEEAGTYDDIPQVYINTQGEVTTDYFPEANTTITVVDKEGGTYNDIIDTVSNIKIRGNSTASADKKPWNIKFNSKRNVLGMTKGKKWSLLANAYDKSLMRNKLALEMGHSINMPYTSESRYVEVYINGTYNGNYLLITPVEVKKERVNIDAYDADSLDVLLELGTRYEADVNHFTTTVLGTTFDVNDPEKDGDIATDALNAKIERIKNYLNNYETCLKTGDYNEIVKYMDVDSFVDFYVISEFFKNADFNFSSTRFYIKNNKIYAGPLWDFDLSCGNLNPNSYADYYDDGVSYKNYRCRKMTWYAKLFDTDWFQAKVQKRFEEMQYIIQNMYMEDSTEQWSIQHLVDNYGMSFERDCRSKLDNGAGWSLKGGGGYVGISYATTARWKTWDEPIEFVREWMKNRNQWLCEAWGVDMENAYNKYDPNRPADPATIVVETTTQAETTQAEETQAETTIQPQETTSGKYPTYAPTTQAVTTKSITVKNTAGPKIKKPAKTTIRKARKIKKRRVKIKLKKISGIKGYQIMIAANKKFTKKCFKHKYSKHKLTVKLSRKYKKIFIKARTYIKVKGKTVYSKWSSVKKR